MLPLLALRTGAGELDDLALLTEELNRAANEASKQARGFVQRRKSVPPLPDPPPPPPPRPKVQPPIVVAPEVKFRSTESSDYDSDDFANHDSDRYESGDELDDLDASEDPEIPVDIDINIDVLEDTVFAMDRIIRGEVTRREMMQLLVNVRRNTTELWNAVVDCYRQNQELEREREARKAQEDAPAKKEESGPRSATPAAYTTTAERVRTPKSLQKIMALIAAMMAVLSLAGPELITAVDNTRPMGNADGGGGGGVVFTVTDPSLPPGRAPLPALPPPPERGGARMLIPKNAAGRSGARDARPPLKGRTPPTPRSPAPSAPPPPLEDYADEMSMHPDDLYTPVDPVWWREYLQRALIAGGVGLMGMAKESARR
jgi:hypothetical protein